MKLSKSKLDLAKVINENGGWKDANFAAQEKCGLVYFYFNEPKRGGLYWHGSASPATGIEAEANSNWYRCFISREEYYQAYPKADADGWIEWKGGECPVAAGVEIEVKRRSELGCCLEDKPESVNWLHYDTSGDIIAYRLHKPEVKHEFCEYVTRSIPEPELDDAESRLAKALELVKEAAPHLLSDQYKFNGYEVMGERKPTIEQLAADYRNRNDFAGRMQQYADEAKADAKAKLGELAAACKAIGLDVSPITEKKDHELAITDWRDLKVGDVIEYVDGDIKDKIGMSGPVVRIDEGDSDGLFVRIECDNGPNKGRFGWPRKWRFIRRP